MERHEIDNHPMQHLDDDHAHKEGLIHIMATSADLRAPMQMDYHGFLLDQRCSRRLSAQRAPSSRIWAGRDSIVPYKRQRSNSFGTFGYLLVLIASIWIAPISAVFIEFQNCLEESYQHNVPLQLQLVPMFVSAVFNTTDPSHNLNVTVYTNVTGSMTGNIQYVLPPANDTAYWNSNDTTSGGKIIDNPFSDTVAKYTTLDNKVSVLTYQPYNFEEAFCGALGNGICPLGPTFNANA
jgi:hypothetical protein